MLKGVCGNAGLHAFQLNIRTRPTHVGHPSMTISQFKAEDLSRRLSPSYWYRKPGSVMALWTARLAARTAAHLESAASR